MTPTEEDKSTWLALIGATLKEHGGSRDKRVEVYRLAQEIVATPGAWELGVCGLFLSWVEHKMYLVPEDARGIAGHLPRDVMERRAGETPRQWEARVDARKQRVERCAEKLREGWDQLDAVHFVCSEEEWQDALQRSRRTEVVDIPEPESEDTPIPEQVPFDFIDDEPPLQADQEAQEDTTHKGAEA